MTARSNSSPEIDGALRGVRVVDLTSVVFGPYATQTLGDMGADVIKVEPPEGDIMRTAQPARTQGMGGVYLNANRNKRAIVLDLKQQPARDALLRVVRDAHVFIHSLRPPAIAKLGLTYEALRAVKPDIIYASAWGFYSKGPYARRPAYDDVIQGMSGTANLTQRRGSDAPDFAPMVMADKVSGLHAVNAVVTALFHHARTGEGQEIEIPMFESTTAFNLIEHFSGAVFEPPLSPPGYARVLDPNRKPHKTADGFMVVLPYNDKQVRAFFTAANRPELATDPRFANATVRSANIDAFYATVAEVIAEKSTAEWTALLSKADVPSVPINRIEDVLDDPHFRETGFFETYEHPTEGTIRTTAVPLKFSKTPGNATRLPPPQLGQHTREVLREAELDDSEIDALLTSGAAWQSP